MDVTPATAVRGSVKGIMNASNALVEGGEDPMTSNGAAVTFRDAFKCASDGADDAMRALDFAEELEHERKAQAWHAEMAALHKSEALGRLVITDDARAGGLRVWRMSLEARAERISRAQERVMLQLQLLVEEEAMSREGVVERQERRHRQFLSDAMDDDLSLLMQRAGMYIDERRLRRRLVHVEVVQWQKLQNQEASARYPLLLVQNCCMVESRERAQRYLWFDLERRRLGLVAEENDLRTSTVCVEGEALLAWMDAVSKALVATHEAFSAASKALAVHEADARHGIVVAESVAGTGSMDGVYCRTLKLAHGVHSVVYVEQPEEQSRRELFYESAALRLWATSVGPELEGILAQIDDESTSEYAALVQAEFHARMMCSTHTEQRALLCDRESSDRKVLSHVLELQALRLAHLPVVELWGVAVLTDVSRAADRWWRLHVELPSQLALVQFQLEPASRKVESSLMLGAHAVTVEELRARAAMQDTALVALCLEVVSGLEILARILQRQETERLWLEALEEREQMASLELMHGRLQLMHHEASSRRVLGMGHLLEAQSVAMLVEAASRTVLEESLCRWREVSHAAFILSCVELLVIGAYEDDVRKWVWVSEGADRVLITTMAEESAARFAVVVPLLLRSQLLLLEWCGRQGTTYQEARDWPRHVLEPRQRFLVVLDEHREFHESLVRGCWLVGCEAIARRALEYDEHSVRETVRRHREFERCARLPMLEAEGTKRRCIVTAERNTRGDLLRASLRAATSLVWEVWLEGLMVQYVQQSEGSVIVSRSQLPQPTVHKDDAAATCCGGPDRPDYGDTAEVRSSRLFQSAMIAPSPPQYQRPREQQRAQLLAAVAVSSSVLQVHRHKAEEHVAALHGPLVTLPVMLPSTSSICSAAVPSNDEDLLIDRNLCAVELFPVVGTPAPVAAATPPKLPRPHPSGRPATTGSGRSARTQLLPSGSGVGVAQSSRAAENVSVGRLPLIGPPSTFCQNMRAAMMRSGAPHQRATIPQQL